LLWTPWLASCNDMNKALHFVHYALYLDLMRRSSLALVLASAAIAVSVAVCGILFAAASAFEAYCEDRIARSGAVNSMEVAARRDKELGTPWAAPPIGTDNAQQAISRLVAILRRDLGPEAVVCAEPAWLSPGWVYVFLAHPDKGGVGVAVGVALTSPTDPEGRRVADSRLAGGWVTDSKRPQIVLPRKTANRLWQGVLFAGEPCWLGITDDSVCAEARVAGIFDSTKGDYCFATAPIVEAIQAALSALDEAIDDTQAEGDVHAQSEPRKATLVSNGSQEELPGVSGASRFATIRCQIYFRDRGTVLKARRLAEDRLKFWVRTPFDDFDSELQLLAAARTAAWAALSIMLVTVFGALLCTFLSWVSRRKYEIAILKAQGSGNWWVAGAYVVQSAFVGTGAGLAGLWLARLLCPRLAAWIAAHLGQAVPLSVSVPTAAAASLLAAFVGMCVVAALIPALAIARQDPWEVLRR